MIHFVEQKPKPEIRLCRDVYDLMAASGCSIESAVSAFQADAKERSEVRTDERVKIVAALRAGIMAIIGHPDMSAFDGAAAARSLELLELIEELPTL